MGPGESVVLGRYAYRFDKLEPVEGPNYDGVRAQLTVMRDGRQVAVLYPEKRSYWVQRSTMTEAGIDSRWSGDLFVGGLRMGEIPGTGHLERVLFNEKMEELRRESLLVDLRQRIRDVKQGPDGLLYVATDEEKGAILRIEPAE